MVRTLLFVLLHSAAAVATVPLRVDDAYEPDPMQSEPLAVTYRGPCNADVVDASGILVECRGGERPVCFNDGTCTCEADVVCPAE